MPTDSTDFVIITSDIVSSFVAHNTVRPNELPDLIASVHASLGRLTEHKTVEEPVPELKPSVSVKKSITNDYLICLDDGRKFRSLRRHLAVLGMTPDEYRAKWGLAKDYPMVAPGYSVKRSELARATGLGTKRPSAEPPAPEPVKPRAKKSRLKAAAVQQAA